MDDYGEYRPITVRGDTTMTTPIDRERLRKEANAYRVYGADWFADNIEALLAALDEAEARVEEARAVALQEARAVALQEAAEVAAHEADYVPVKPEDFRKAILALMDTPAAEALERVRAEEREVCAQVVESNLGRTVTAIAAAIRARSQEKAPGD